jgi:hypothetical protein
MTCERCGGPLIGSYEYCPGCGLPTIPGSGKSTRYAATTSRPLGPGRSPTPFGSAPLARPDPNLAFVLELLPGLFGFLGIGHMVCGSVGRGLALLVGWWVFLGISGLGVFVLGALTLGVGWCLFPILLLVYLLGPALSALWVKRELEGRPFSLRP